MLLALGLLIPALLAAAVVAYGTHPHWARFGHGGVDFILWSYRLQWPLVVLSLLLCLALVGFVIAGRRRAWWLIGLGPVLALFVHRFATDPGQRVAVAENPVFVTADESAPFLGDEDYVVGLRFNDTAYAYPYAALFSTPVVLQSDHDRRMVLLWSAYANRALAVEAGREVRGRDLEVVSQPANALIVYDARSRVFINGVTGATPDGAAPPGFGKPLPLVKTTWRRWREVNPETMVLTASAGTPRTPAAAPARPILPSQPMPASTADATPVVLVGSTDPVAVRCDAVGEEPLNLSADGQPVLVFRDGGRGGVVRAFSRKLEEDLRPTFRLNPGRAKRPRAALVDDDTGTSWDVNGVAVTGPKEYVGRRLTPVPADDRVYWGVVKFWYPQARLEGGKGSSAGGGGAASAAVKQ